MEAAMGSVTRIVSVDVSIDPVFFTERERLASHLAGFLSAEGCMCEPGRTEGSGENEVRPVDSIEEGLMESFPASDPPGHGCGHA
jgi:hypothetical protein